MKEILSRFAADLPKFFKRLRAVGLSVSSVGTALAAIPSIPVAVAAIGAKLIWVGLAMAAVAQLTCQDPGDITPSKP